MHIWLTLLVLAALAVLWLFYDKFTARGAIPIKKAARDFTTWFGLLSVVLADWIVALLQWVSGFWEPLQAHIGPVLSAAGSPTFLVAWGALMLALKFKGQTPLPKVVLPDFPSAEADDTAAPSA